MARFIPPLTWFRAFESSARLLSFTKAAAELNLTQSAISQHVRALEDELGCQLFIRIHRGLILTDQGRRLLPAVSTAISTLSSAAESFITYPENNTLTVAASSSIARWYIVPHLKTFTDAHPHISVRLTARSWPDEFSSLDNDVEIRFDSAQSSSQDATLLTPNAMQIVAARSLVPERSSASYSSDEIAKLPLIQVVGTADTWKDWAVSKCINTELNTIALVESHGLAVDMARAGLGVAYTNAIIAAPSVLDGSLHVIENFKDVPKEGYYLKIQKTDEKSLAGAFGDWLKELIQKPQSSATKF
jgi:LysR family glycine cleavage system transcriptional activator